MAEPCRYDGPHLCASCGKPADPRCYLLPTGHGRKQSGYPACLSCCRSPDITAVLRRIPRTAKRVRYAPRIVTGGIEGTAAFTWRCEP